MLKKGKTRIRRMVAVLLMVIMSINLDLVEPFVVSVVKTENTSKMTSGKMVVKAASKKKYNKKAKKAYMKFLKGYFVHGKSFSYQGRKHKWRDDNSARDRDKYYLIRDINHDGKVELLVFNSGRPEEYLFTYYKGKVKCVADFGYHNYFKESKKGKIIVISGANCGTESNSIYVLKKGKLKYVAGVGIENKQTGTGRQKNGKTVNEWSFSNSKGKISKAKFSQILKKYTGSSDIKAFCVCYMSSKNVNTQLKKIKYKTYKMPKIKKVSGIQVSKEMKYSVSSGSGIVYESMKDVVNVSWDPSVKGNVQVTYATNAKFSDKKTKTIKAESYQNSCQLKNLYGGKTYYIKLRTYTGDKSAFSDYSKVYRINVRDYQCGVKKVDNIIYYGYEENGISYICGKDETTDVEITLFTSNYMISLKQIEENYMYYTENKGISGHEGDLYVYNLNTNQKTYMLDLVYYVTIEENKVFCRQDFWACDFSKADLYSFDLDGTNKRLVIEGIPEYFIHESKIYWYEQEYDNEEGEYAITLKCCDFYGQNKMNVTSTIYREDLYDFDYSKEYALKYYIK